MKALLLCLIVSTASAQSMSVHVGQRGAFQPNGAGGGIITGNVDIKTEVQFPTAGGGNGPRSVVVGGHQKGADVGSSQSTGPGSRTSSISNGGGGYSEITVTPVPVITGPEPRPLTGMPGREVLALLGSADPSDRLSAADEIGRRPWNPRARKLLTRNLAARLGDESPRVAGASATAMAKLADPEAAALIVPHLQGRDSDRIVPLIEALAELGDPRATRPLTKLADHIDLAISLAASKALTTLERRQREQERVKQAAAPKPAVPR